MFHVVREIYLKFSSDKKKQLTKKSLCVFSLQIVIIKRFKIVVLLLLAIILCVLLFVFLYRFCLWCYGRIWNINPRDYRNFMEFYYTFKAFGFKNHSLISILYWKYSNNPIFNSILNIKHFRYQKKINKLSLKLFRKW